MTIKGQIADVVNKRIFGGELTIENDRIIDINEIENAPDQYILPGFIDAHVHVESSMLIPSEFARLAVCHGTVATVSDPHEIGNVLGKEGVRFMIENGNKTPFKFYFGVPSCVPATTFETAGATIDLADIEDMLHWPNVNYLAEMMNYPGVLAGDKEVMAKITLAKKLGKQVDGHAPGLMGEEAQKYIAQGITTDHECFTKEEALNKLENGMKIIIREGSAAKNFEALWPLIDQFPDQVMFCSDDKHPNDLVAGHINQLVARAVAKGCDIFNVLRAASLNPVRHYHMHVGLLQPGDFADFCIVNNLNDFEVSATYIDGKRVANQGKTHIDSIEESSPNQFHCLPLSTQDIQLRDIGRPIRVMVVEDGQLITTSTTATVPAENGYLTSDIAQDVLKIVVVNRYTAAAPAVGFIKNIGLASGAIASCVAHDSHNIIAVGVDDHDICAAINLIIEAKGGISLASSDQKQVVELPVAGIMTTKDGYAVAEAYEAIDRAAKALGSGLSAPYMTLSFCALLVIPQLKLSDKGLFDGNEFELTSIYAD